MRDIHIKKAMNGFIVTVGCQTLVFEGRERLIRELDLYLEHPDKVEQQYIKDYGMKGCDIAVPGQEIPSSYYNNGSNSTGLSLGSFTLTGEQRQYNTASEGSMKARERTAQ